MDETTTVVFRRRLREAGLTTQLFDAVVGHLQTQGLFVDEGTIADATIIQAPQGKKTKDASGEVKDTRDTQAGFTKKPEFWISVLLMA